MLGRSPPCCGSHCGIYTAPLFSRSILVLLVQRLVLMPGRYIQHNIAKPDYSTLVSLEILSVLVCQFYTDVNIGLSFEGRTWAGGFWQQCEGEYWRRTGGEHTKWRISQLIHFAKYYLWKRWNKFVELAIYCSMHNEVWNIHAKLYSESMKVGVC